MKRGLLVVYPIGLRRRLRHAVSFTLLAGFALVSLPACAAAAPQKPVATVWFVQVYDVKEGQVESMRKWVAEEGGKQFLAFPGAVSFETWVDLIHPGPTLITVLGFADYATIDRFYADKSMAAWGERLDSFIGPHKHYIFRQYPLYRSRSLSNPPPTP
jgi:hypothetical protein